MDLNDLKKAWDQFSSREKEKELDEKALREMLRGRTKSLIEKIERNIKIGFGIIFLLIILLVVDDLILSPVLAKSIDKDIEVPAWLIVISLFSYVFLFATFIYFVIKYYRIKKECDITCELTKTLNKTIHILNLYQRMFYFGLLALILSFTINFIAGFYIGLLYEAENIGITADQIKTTDILLPAIFGLFILLLITGSLFLFFRWGFRRLYGNYLAKLKLTLAELNEID
ncbi:MAG: hypothetical protein JXR31_09795 [Prolixibacteraceae bacterium]|nr:hypothetical protein [Prolixibacteraceae bacterium]MBN2774528.1 hypothetical protein [Prolixibacteraceae bacterium]